MHLLVMSYLARALMQVSHYPFCACHSPNCILVLVVDSLSTVVLKCQRSLLGAHSYLDWPHPICSWCAALSASM